VGQDHLLHGGRRRSGGESARTIHVR
jgi:hypothetical protein